MKSASRIISGEGDKSLEIVWRDSERILCKMSRNGAGPSQYAFTPALYASEHPTSESIERLEHEFKLKDYLESDWAVRPLELIRDRGRTMLVVDFRGEERLDRLIRKPLEIGQFLRFAVELAVAIGRLHGRGLVHKDIKPAHILVDSATSGIRLTGFGIASRLPREHQPPSPPEFIAGTLPYMAPEQTGRMNRSIDSRSDLYSVGVTLYQMITGSLPFEASDPLEWVHCHIAKKPVPPAVRLENIPDPVSSIIIRLLAKTLEERYQTASGLENDLRKCLAAWTTCGRIDAFTLGERDVPDRLMIPEKLYGREEEINLLLAALARISAGGATELMLVCGYAGIGKSSIVNELHKALVSPRVLFASGKFDQYKRDIPYATLAQAFQSLIRPLLSKPEEELSRWRDDLRKAMEPHGQLMVELVPELKHIIGEQPPIPELSPQEAQGRFKQVFRRFISVFARPEHPLVLFLDDLQWLDMATLDLLEDLLTRADLRHLLLIGAYRNNEVDAFHPLMRRLGSIKAAGTGVVGEITLGVLDAQHVSQLIADALHCETDRAADLAQLILQKTDGNPFFTNQFLSALMDEGLITFDSVHSRWSWDLHRIHAKGYTDNVADLMIGKLVRLPPATQQALQKLACLGNIANAAMLAIVHETAEQQVHVDLAEARRQELVDFLENSYRFVHDRVHEAAYALIPAGERAVMHLGIGRMLVAHTPPGKLDETIFEIVNQLNRGAALITSRGERVQLAELNLLAGQRAKQSTAYNSALTYLATGRALLPEDCPEEDDALNFSLEFYRAECEFLTGALTAAEERLSKMANRTDRLVDFAAVTNLRAEIFTTLGRSDRAIEACRDYLRHVGIEWATHPMKEAVRQEYDRLRRQTEGRSIEELVDLPPMTDPECRATMDVLTAIVSPALFTDENLLCLVICRMANLSLEHGNSDGSCFAYVWLGMLLGPHFGDYRIGFRFGKLGLDLVEQRGLRRFEARVYLIFGHRVIPWTQPIRTGRSLVRRAFDAANKLGDLTFAAYSRDNLITNLLASGDPLSDVQREAEAGLDFARKARFGLVIDRITTQLRLIRTLRGLTPEFTSFNDAEFDEGRFEQHLKEEPQLAIAACWYWIRKLQARFFAGAHASAIAAAANAERILWTSPSFFELAEYHFYSALTRAAVCDSASAEERDLQLEALALHHRQLQEWAENCPENFANRVALVGAEMARIEGRDFDAMRLYEQAIRSAREQGFVQNEGVAHEVAARFYAARGFETIADTYLGNARYCYVRWGADGKVRQLDRLYPHLAAAEGQRPAAIMGSPVQHLDVASVVKASQALSSEIVLPKLIERLMKIAIENAGADRGLLILPSGKEYLVQAEARASGDQIEVTVRQGPMNRITCPESVVRYVIRTRESVILDDASKPGLFSGDDYLRDRQSKSILCLPLIKQGKLTGVLLLENALTSHAFTPARIAVLELLVAQAAISFENARLYSELSRGEALLSEAQKLSLTGSFGWNVSSGELFWSNETFRILDCDPVTKPSVETVFSRTHPDDIAIVKQALGQAARDGTNLDFEHRLLLSSGVVKHVHVVGHAVGGPAGKEFVGAVMDVTSSHQARMALEKAFSEIKRSEESFRLMADNIPGLACVMTATGETEIVNQRVLDYTGKTLEKLNMENWASIVHPDDLDHVASIWAHSVATGCPYEIEHRILSAAGEYRWFHVRGLAMRDADGRVVRWYVSLDETHDRRMAEEKLARSERFLAEGQRISSTGTFSWRLDTDEVTFSEELNRIFEFDRNSVVTLEQIGQRVHPEDVPFLSATIGRTRNGEDNFDYDIRLRMPDGRIKYLHTFSHTMRHQDGRLESLGAVQDITQRRLSDEALDKVRSELAHVSRITTLGELAASIAHEVNQPLGAVVTNANACLRLLDRATPDLDEVRAAIRSIARDGNRGSDVIGRIRGLTKKEQSKRTRININETVKEIVLLAQFELQGTDVQIELAEQLPNVIADQVQLQQVMLNLITNAIEAMKSLSNHPRTLRIETKPHDGDAVLVSVRDSGMGIGEGKMDHLFETFYTTKPHGLGMGLSISHSIIESHGGRLWANDNDGPGATFTFTLPSDSGGAA